MRNARLSFFVWGKEFLVIEIVFSIFIFLFRKVKLWYTKVQKRQNEFLKI